MKKRKMLILGLAVFCLLAILFSVFWFVPYLRIEVLKIPVRTDVLLPKPDMIVLYFGEQSFALTESEQKDLYQAFSTMLASVESCVRGDHFGETAKIRFEFQYRQPYRYVGTLQTDMPLCEKPFTYDSVSMTFVGSYMRFFPQKGGEIFEIDDGGYTYLAFWDEEAQDRVGALIERYVIEHLLAEPRGDMNTASVTQSNVFPAAPDSAVIYQNGKAVTVTGTSLDEIYHAFTAMTEDMSVSWKQNIWGGFAYGAVKVRDHICIEFRYRKRQKYVSGRPEAELPLAGFPHSTQAQPADVYFHNESYDALLFIVEDMAINQSPVLRLARYYDGVYHFLETPAESLRCNESLLESMVGYMEGVLHAQP